MGVLADDGFEADVCKIVLTFNNSTHTGLSADGEWRPKTPIATVLRYHDNCYDGDCVRTFTDGKKICFQAPHCFDPVDEKWNWKPNGC